ncbi:hypothetical protein CHS0354_026348 [Potamilus streckersoni]|uniref:Uncharacterized protein n=1 Tax=Potamilus streckersoni TaxID=2493646 RepID=A0AAE0T3Z1_9BIVA|nr:hypothetical protein CHS0354_026348 [Potamilus streckersoni]
MASYQNAWYFPFHVFGTNFTWQIHNSSISTAIKCLNNFEEGSTQLFQPAAKHQRRNGVSSVSLFIQAYTLGLAVLYK